MSTLRGRRVAAVVPFPLLASRPIGAEKEESMTTFAWMDEGLRWGRVVMRKIGSTLPSRSPWQAQALALADLLANPDLLGLLLGAATCREQMVLSDHSRG
jgi:hypothetical protein